MLNFHNLKFDGHFIVDYLLKHGYRHIATDRDGMANKEFTTLMSDMGKLYSLKIKWETGHVAEFRDTLKKFPNMSVASVAETFDLELSKGEIDYHALRPEGYIPTEDEIDYLFRDVSIIAQAVKQSRDEGMKRLTIGSDSLAEYKKIIGGEKRFRHRFPVLHTDLDAEIRRAYRGGFTYADKRFQGRRVGNGLVLDVNSLYPAVMYNTVLPYGEPEFVEGQVTPTDTRPLVIFSVTFTAKLKKDHIPCIQIKGSSIFSATEYLEEIAEPTTLMVTGEDWDLYNEQYDVDVLAYGGGWRFRGVRGMFDEFIEKWSAIKEASVGGKRLIAKLYLNNLYGKFCSNPNVTSKYPIIEEERVRWRRGPDERREPVYTPVGVFITSYARALTVRAAQTSYGVFAYADTDSLHLLTDKVPSGIDLHPTRMGAWKHEYDFIDAYYVRPKAYLNLKANGKYKTAWAGLPESEAKKLTFDSLVDGAVLWGKLQPESVPGGVILKDVPYTLKL